MGFLTRLENNAEKRNDTQKREQRQEGIQHIAHNVDHQVEPVIRQMPKKVNESIQLLNLLK